MLMQYRQVMEDYCMKSCEESLLGISQFVYRQSATSHNTTSFLSY